MAPLGNTKLIPDGWAEYHRPIAAGGATADCQVIRVGSEPAPYGEVAPPPPVIWTGKCRLQQHNVMQSPAQAGQPLEVRQYLVMFPRDEANPLPLIEVGEGGDIVEVQGKRYRIRQKMNGSLEWEHDFIAREIQTQQAGGQ